VHQGGAKEWAMGFENLQPVAPDPLLALMGRFRTDSRDRKMDLGVGVYRDAAGETPVFQAVKQAEARLLHGQRTKAYIGAEGDQAFVARLGAQIFGAGIALPGLQTVGGTGALRLAADLLARSQVGRRIWLGTPSWPNHAPIFVAAGLQTLGFDLFRPATARPRPEAMLEALQTSQPGDAVLIHGCCHNPTGIDASAALIEEIAALMVKRGLIPLVDLAYQGLGRGWHEDGATTRRLVERVPTVLVAASCDKNFGLYRERTGALFVSSPTRQEAQSLCSHLVSLARTAYSMPPDHGAAVVRSILEDDDLTELWSAELDAMRGRIGRLRAALAAYGQVGGIDLGALHEGLGMFAMLPLTPQQIERLQAEFGIYMAQSGRINIAGLAEDSIDRFVDALRSVSLAAKQ
jgi:aromatic-amino-acid transaminase